MTNQTIPPCPKCGKVPIIDAQFDDECKPQCNHISSPVATIMIDDWTHSCNYELGRACRELGIETVEQLMAKMQPDPRVAELSGYIAVLLDLATDAANGLEYVRDVHGDLYGVGFDRVKIKAEVLPVIRLKMTQLIAAQRGEE